MVRLGMLMLAALVLVLPYQDEVREYLMTSMPAPESAAVAPVPGLTERRHLAALEKRVAGLEAQLALPVLEPRWESGQALARGVDPEWRLTDPFARQRRYEKVIPFARPFSALPQVVVGFSRLELGREEVSLRVGVERVDERGFLLVIESQSEVRPRETGVNWVAFGK